MDKKTQIKNFESNKNIYIIDVLRNQVIEFKLRKELEKYEDVKSHESKTR